MLRRKLLVSLILTGIFAAGCALNPVTGRRELMLLSESQDLELGKKYAPEVEKELGGRLNNQTIQNYINSVGQKVARISHRPDIEFHYGAVNDDSINAVALPGGYIFITRGMLEQLSSEAQLASVLAHETVHVTARHSAAAMSQQIGIDILLSAVIKENTPQAAATVAQLGSQLVNLKYSRDDEYEADIYGMDYLVKAGYESQGMIEMMEILEGQNSVRPFEFFSTHPNPDNRKEKLLRHINLMGYYNQDRARKGGEDYNRYVLSNFK